MKSWLGLCNRHFAGIKTWLGHSFIRLNCLLCVVCLTLFASHVSASGATSPLNFSLLGAAQKGEVYAARVLLREGASANAKDNDGFTPLMFAARRGNVSIMRLLLERGADVNAISEDLPHNKTPMMEAAEAGRVPVVELLIAFGGRINVRNNDGETALMFAANAATARVLLSYGANVNARTEEFAETPLMRAVSAGKITLTKLLLSRGAYVNQANKQGDAALYLAAVSGLSNVKARALVRLLLAHDADPNRHDVLLDTPLKAAEESHDRVLVRLLKAAGAQH